MSDMRRREFITLLGGAAAAWPRSARAQQTAMPVIGFLHSGSYDAFAHVMPAFHQGLKEAGYVEGQNLAIEYRWANGHYEQLPAMAADLVRRQVAVIAAPGGTPATLSAKRATATIPVVFLTGVDPVALGLVESINRPGGNLTGLSQLNAAMVAKRLELMRELLPAASTVALLVNPANPYTDFEATQVRDAAQSLRLGLRVLNASREAEIDAAFATVAKERISALVVSPDPYLTTRRDQVVAQSARHGIAVISDRREFVAAGGLMSYGTDFGDAYHEMAVYVGRILKGAKPAELPVQQAVKIQFAINLKTAKSLGLTFPIPLLGRADEVIEVSPWPISAFCPNRHAWQSSHGFLFSL